MTLERAKLILRLDTDDNNDVVQLMVDALPDCIEVATGMSPAQQVNEPLVDMVGGFLITLWYYGEHADVDKLQRVIDGLLKAITLKAIR